MQSLEKMVLRNPQSSNSLKCKCYHTWMLFEDWVIDLTGDQFDNDSDINIKTIPVYVGSMSDFHKQFEDLCLEHSCGIECLGEGSKKRMYRLYEAIMKHLEVTVQ